MSANPYAPPTSNVQDVPSLVESPALWNPVAAARWSLLFSPTFGAILNMLNWQALNEPGRAASSRAWAIGTLLASLAAGFLDLAWSGGSRFIGVALLLTWYFASGRKQTTYVRERYGQQYPRRGWAKPLLAAVAALMLFTLAFTAGAMALEALGVIKL